MQNDLPRPVAIEYTPEFKRNLRTLSKKYRHIRSDIQPVLDRLANNEIIGDQIKGTKFTVFKVRVRNSDIAKGKRAGHRLIYYLESPGRIVLVTIYSKAEQGDLSAQKIRTILRSFEKS